MELKLEQDISREEIQVLIRYSRMNRTVRRLEALLHSYQKTLKCTSGDSESWVSVSDIYYAESVDKRTFVYCEDSVYRSGLRLYELLEELSRFGFVQVSKSCIININMLDSIRPLANSRMEASLSNGERVNVTRKYVAAIREKLKEREFLE